MYKYPILLLFILLSHISASAQNPKLDSLKQAERKYRNASSFAEDTTYFNTAYILSREYINLGQFETADSLAEACYEKAAAKITSSKPSQRTFYKKAQAKAISNRGIASSCMGNQNKALDYFSQSLKVFEELKDKANVSKLNGNIGNALKDQSNYARALEYYFRALKLSEEAGTDQATAIHLANIGNAYKAQGNYEKSLIYYFRAMAMAEKLNDKQGIATDLSNIGIVYKNQGNLEKALEFYFKALKMAEEQHYRLLEANTLGNIGSAYSTMKKYPEALDYLNRALVMAQEMGNKGGIARLTGNLAAVYSATGRNRMAEEHYKKALQFSREAGDLYIAGEQHAGLARLYEREGRYDESLKEYKLFSQTKDSIFNNENTKKTLFSELNFEFEKKAAADSIKNAGAQQIKDAALKAQAAQLKQERTQKYSLYGGLLIVLIFSFFLLNRFQIIKKQKQVIEVQKTLVEEKNREVMDSINYAKRIQEALLKESSEADEAIPDHFILFMPKDIVSGDFYWSTKKQDYWYFCVADCTGHGVPGAFMCMLGIAYLNEITAAAEPLTPAVILDKLREKIVKELKQRGQSGENKDGMDISLIRYNLSTGEMQWAGANNPLWIYRQSGQVLEEIAPDKQPIGYTILPRPFRNNSVSVQKNDVLYLFTDGYADQFGGPKGKKFKYKQLKEKLAEVSERSLDDQKTLLSTTFEGWKGSLEQLDDVALAGIRI